MLKKSAFSPARPWRAVTRLFPCSVLASFRSSLYSRGYASGLHSLRPCWTAFLSILRFRPGIWIGKGEAEVENMVGDTGIEPVASSV